MEAKKAWFFRLFTSDHRRSSRHSPSNLVAYYWEGTAPVAHRIQNISSTGFYMLTKERWHPGTIVTMTLQKDAVAGSHSKLYIAVQTRVVRLGKDGVGFSFVHPEFNGAWQGEVRSNALAGRRAFERFIDQILSEQGYVTLGAPVRESWLERRAKQISSGGGSMKTLRQENGQALIITVLSMTILLGFSALAADVGMMYRTKRILQTAADAAAVAGALVINYGGVSSAAQTAASQNNVTNGVNGATVTVNNPPSLGPHAGNSSYVEVIVSQVVPTVFMRVFNVKSLTVSARAVAYNGGSSYGCLYTMNPTASMAIQLQGAFLLNAPNCGVIDNSNAANALYFVGSAGSLVAGSVGVVGGVSGQVGDSSPTPVTGIVPVSDPLGYIVPPNPASLSCTSPPQGNLTGTIGPAAPGGTVCYSGSVTINNATLNPGTYVFTGASSSTVTLGNVTSAPGGVTLDINNGSLVVSTNTSLNLTAPTSGPYNGIVIMQPVLNTNQMQIQFGSSFGTLDGIIWAPGANLFLQDNGSKHSGGVNLTTDLIVNTLYDKASTLNITSYSQTTGTSPLSKVSLVE